jgi:hypothetical protein
MKLDHGGKNLGNKYPLPLIGGYLPRVLAQRN